MANSVSKSGYLEERDQIMEATRLNVGAERVRAFGTGFPIRLH